MKLCQIKEYSQNVLRKNKLKSLFIAIFLPSISGFFKLAEICLASIMLYLMDTTPLNLLYQLNPLWTIFSIISEILKIVLFSAVTPAVIWYFSKLINMNILPKKRYFSSVMGDSYIFKRSISAIMLKKIISFIFLIPVIFFSIISVKFIMDGYKNGNSDIIFLTVHSFVLTLISIAVWIWSLLGLSAFPFLILKYHKANVFKLMIVSFKIMNGSRTGLMKIIVYYFSKLLIPFSFIWILSEFMSSYSLYINICIKEAEYIAQHNLYSRKSNRADISSKISDRKKRRFKTSADQT